MEEGVAGLFAEGSYQKVIDQDYQCKEKVPARK